MSIRFDSQRNLFTIYTDHTSYQMKVDEYGMLLHVYYGQDLGDEDASYIHLQYDRGCSGNPPEARDRTYSADTLPLEYTGCGVGDYRINSIALTNADGSRGLDLRYAGHEIQKGKYTIPGLPASYDGDGEAETLIITLKDALTKVAVQLYYGVFPEKDMITRAARIQNEGASPVILTKAASLCLDLTYGEWDLLHFPGRYALERQPERIPVSHTATAFGSNRGTSSHQENPFFILCDKKTDEEHGSCFGFMLVYSGSFLAQVEMSQLDSTRVVLGLSPEGFTWTLQPGESFETPEVLMSFTHRGLTALSHAYHRFLRHNICRGEYALRPRPILINNWEATYFDFNEKKLLQIAKEAASMGIEMLVLDDGWYGHRSDDTSSLGDWYVNEEKLGGPLSSLIEKIKAEGLRFGIWIEPEMISEDSELYRTHPDWAIAMPGRTPVRSRSELVLDMTRKEIRDYLYERISDLLTNNDISYVKWDMNRSLCDLYSPALPAVRQGEMAHRQMLGSYELMERLTNAFPHVLFEGCAAGGARFDAGLLCYMPQIWCSDNTDPIQRLKIQYGTSFGYPICTVGAHVSASPNHQTGRSTPMHTRAVTAISGTFGYELDPDTLTEAEKNMVREQIRTYRKYASLIANGDYYRLTEGYKKGYAAWEFAAEDGSEALLNLVIVDTAANPPLIHLHLKGLDSEGLYRIETESGSSAQNPQSADSNLHTGRALLYAGYTCPMLTGDYPALQVHFVRVD